ncbi:MAG TPA: zinc ribbon domain-containing protein [Pyrinomonadaceae bacterium]|nr:zinc ribbon domain-containing protein [Pyrinomonadaceae bacterium]
MYCISCGAPVTPGLSYCNRCGTSLKEPEPARNVGVMSIIVIAMTLIGLGGLGIMLGGTALLKTEANLAPDLVGLFMLFCFLVVIVTEFSLFRNLSKLVSSSSGKQRHLPPAQSITDLRLPPATPFGEPVSSVTENTTRTLEYARRQQ